MLLNVSQHPTTTHSALYYSTVLLGVLERPTASPGVLHPLTACDIAKITDLRDSTYPDLELFSVREWSMFAVLMVISPPVTLTVAASAECRMPI